MLGPSGQTVGTVLVTECSSQSPKLCSLPVGYSRTWSSESPVKRVDRRPAVPYPSPPLEHPRFPGARLRVSLAAWIIAKCVDLSAPLTRVRAMCPCSTPKYILRFLVVISNDPGRLCVSCALALSHDQHQHCWNIRLRYSKSARLCERAMSA